MRWSIALICLLFSCSFCLAAEEKQDGPSNEVPGQQLKQEQIKAKPAIKPAAREADKGPSWPRPYKSREEVSVDSVVPFPTDI